MFNYDELKKLSEEKPFFLVLADGSQIPMANLTKKGRYYRGTNYINNVPCKVLVEELAGHFYIDDENFSTNHTYRYLQNHYQTAGDVYAAENLSIDDSPYFYKNLEVYQKAICAMLNSEWEDITVDSLKQFWKDKILQACVKFEEYIEKELVDSNDNPQFTAELTLIKEQLNTEVKSFNEVENFETKEDLCKFWPTLLMPAPSFVNN